MKTLTIVSIIILLLFFAKNLFSVDAEKNYTLIKKLDKIEIRNIKAQFTQVLFQKMKKKEIAHLEKSHHLFLVIIQIMKK